MNFSRVSPLTGEIASTATAMSPAVASAIADAAAAAFTGWSQTGPNTRRALLLKAADALAARKDEFVTAMVAEVGATAGWAMINLMLAGGMLREAAALTTQITGDGIPSDKPGCVAMALREPAGVVMGIAPWNVFFFLCVRVFVVPLASGITAILKASDMCPRTHALIVEAFCEAGFPENVVSIVTYRPEDAGSVVGALIDHPAVRRINFTGSTHVGRIDTRRTTDNQKPRQHEHRSKTPLLVLA